MTATKTIKSGIATYLADIVGITKNIRKMYSYFEPNPSEFPCIMVYSQNSSEERLDFRSNAVSQNFMIKVCIPLEKGADMADMEDLRTDCVDDVKNRLRKSDAVETLGGLVYEANTNVGEPYVEENATFPLLVCDIIVETKRQEFITS